MPPDEPNPKQEQKLEDRIKRLEDEIKRVKARDMEDKIKELKEEMETLDLWLTVASENGVFTNEGHTSINQQSDANQPKSISNTEEGCIGVPKSFKEAQEYMKLVWDRLYAEEKHMSEGSTGQDNKPEESKDANDDTRSGVMLSIGDCETYLSKVFEFYNRSIKEFSRKRWGINRLLINGVHIIGYLTLLLILTVLATLVWNVHTYLNIGLLDNRYSMVIYAATVIGFIGGITRSMYNIVHEVRLRVFRRASWAEYIMAPFIGGSLAFIITIGIIAGLITDIQPIPLQGQTGQEQQNIQTERSMQQPYGLYLIAFATGLFWRNAINKLRNILGEKGGLEDRDGDIRRIE